MDGCQILYMQLHFIDKKTHAHDLTSLSSWKSGAGVTNAWLPIGREGEVDSLFDQVTGVHR